MKKTYKTPFALAMTASLLPMAVQAESNPFSLSDLGPGYMQTAEAAKDGTDKMKDGACGEGKCGAAMMGNKAPDKKALEGKCAGNKPSAPAAADSQKMPNGNCGANMKMGK